MSKNSNILMVMIVSLLQRIWTNLRTIVVFFAVVITASYLARCQTSLYSHSGLAETDTRSAPLRPILNEFAIDIQPAPFGHTDLTRTHLALGMPDLRSSMSLSIQGAPGIMQTSASVLRTWTPRSGYRMATILAGQWNSIAFFTDQWSVGVDVAAEFHIAEWHISAGLFDAITFGRMPRSEMLIGLSMITQETSLHVECSSSWQTSPRFSISTALDLADSVSAVARIQASPLGADVAMRTPAGKKLHLVVGMRYLERLGIQSRITLCWQSPSW